MPNTKVIPTHTTLSVIATSMKITTAYFDNSLGGIIQAFITASDSIVDGIGFIQGEGGITINRAYFSSPPSFSMNSNGELEVTAADANKYSIDPLTGSLIYTT